MCPNLFRLIVTILSHKVPLPIILVKCTMGQSTGTINIGQVGDKVLLSLNNGPIPRCAHLMFQSGIQSVNYDSNYRRE